MSIGFIPEVPSWKTRLARGLGEGLSQGLSQSQNLASQLMLKKAEESSKSNRLNSLLKRNGSTVSDQSLGNDNPDFDLSQLSPEEMGVLATQFPDFVNSFLKTEKLNLEKSKSPQTQLKEKSQHILNIGDQMRDLIEYTGGEFGIKTIGKSLGLRRETIQKRAHFDQLAAAYASYFRDLETKGQLPKGLFDAVIKPRLPNSELSERDNLGRIDGMDALAKEFGGLEKTTSQSKKGKPTFSFSNPEHNAKYNQLVKKYGENHPEIERILGREFILTE